MRERLTTEKRKIFARENITIMSMTKDELRQHYNEIFDRLQEYEVAEENGNIIVTPCKVGDKVYQYDTGGRIYESQIMWFYYDKDYKRVVYDCDSGLAFSKEAIGVSVYLSREEAEKALKECEK